MSDKRERLELWKLKIEIWTAWVTPVVALLAIAAQFFLNQIQLERREIQVATAELQAAQSVKAAADRENAADAMFSEAQQALQDAQGQVIAAGEDLEKIQSESESVSASVAAGRERLRETEQLLSEANDRLTIASQRSRETLSQYTLEVEPSVESAAAIGQQLEADGFTVSPVSRPDNALDIAFLNPDLPDGIRILVVSAVRDIDGNIPVCRATLRTNLAAVLGTNAIRVSVQTVGGIVGGGSRQILPRSRLNALPQDDCVPAVDWTP